MHSGVLFGLTLLLGQLCVCNGVKCYDCIYSTAFSEKLNSNPDCNDAPNFNAKNLTDHLQASECNGKCFKSRLSGAGEVNIIRKCVSTCVPAGAGGFGMFCCATDFCNDSWRMQATLVGALASVLAAYLLRA